MASSVLEMLRSTHEEIEKLEKVASQLMLHQENTCGRGHDRNAGTLGILGGLGVSEKKRRESLRIDCAIADIVGRIKDCSNTCLNVYKDKDDMKKDESAFLGGISLNNKHADVWVNFYDRLKDIRNAHKRRVLANMDNQILAMQPLDVTHVYQEYMQTPYLDALFDEEESYGRHVNLQQQFITFTNLKNIRRHKQEEFRKAEIARLRRKGLGEDIINARIAANQSETEQNPTDLDYVYYLKHFSIFNTIPRYLKYHQQEYISYLESLLEYLQDFFSRRNPLADFSKVTETFESNFKKQFTNGHIPGWEEPTHKLALYCVVTDRLFANENTFNNHKRGKKYEKKLLLHTQKSSEEQNELIKKSQSEDYRLAKLEFCINSYREILEDAVVHTIATYQKKQSRGADELHEEEEPSDDENEDGAMPAISDDSDIEDEAPVYNPLNLPLGFDGRPIPYWLYKLHGLGQEYKCEICGNFSYWGRRAFERHFSEWRHSFGMRCLKIPNTTHFKEITKIEDAIRLYEQLKKQAEGFSFRQDQELECEDIEGNVMTLRAFEDLRRQGLI